jgi:hypothetical protein
MNASMPAPEPTPRQRFPTKKQALTIFFGSIVLSLTTCTTVLIVFGERQLDDFGSFLVGAAVYICFFGPVAGFIVLIMYFVRRRSTARRDGVS